MYKKKTLFIGCGDGRELLPLTADPEHLLIGLEPSNQLFARARDSLKGFQNVELFHGRIQDFKAAQYAGEMDRIYLIFPSPEILCRGGPGDGGSGLRFFSRKKR